MRLAPTLLDVEIPTSDIYDRITELKDNQRIHNKSDESNETNWTKIAMKPVNKYIKDNNLAERKRSTLDDVPFIISTIDGTNYMPIVDHRSFIMISNGEKLLENDGDYCVVKCFLSPAQRQQYNVRAAQAKMVIPYLTKHYVHGMGGCDRLDQSYGYTLNKHRNAKYWHRIFRYLMIIASKNARVHFKKNSRSINH